MEMTLKLPSNYQEIEEEEIMYLDGGWSPYTLYYNLKGLTNRYSYISRVLKGSALVASTGIALKLSFWGAVAKFGWDVVVAATYIGGFYAACFAAAGTAFAIAYLGERRVFY